MKGLLVFVALSFCVSAPAQVKEVKINCEWLSVFLRDSTVQAMLLKGQDTVMISPSIIEVSACMLPAIKDKYVFHGGATHDCYNCIVLLFSPVISRSGDAVDINVESVSVPGGDRDWVFTFYKVKDGYKVTDVKVKGVE